jgi:hypothetical protein
MTITLLITKAAWYIRTFSRKPTHPSAPNQTLPLSHQIFHIHSAQLNILQNHQTKPLYSPQIENDSHKNLPSLHPLSPRPTSSNPDILELKNMKGLFDQLTSLLSLLTSALPKLTK